MKNIKLIALLVCLTVIVCSFAGCAKTAPLSFDAKGGTISGEQPAEYTTSDALALPSASLQYYAFKGWSLNSDGSGTLYTELPAELELTEEQIENGMKLYAVWERLSAKITYALEGGENAADAPTSYNYGDEVDLPTPTKQYFEFKGWNLDGKAFEKIEKSQEGDLNLVATWLQVETPITFVLGLDGASLPDADPTFATDEGIEDLMDDAYIPVADGYIFAGWYADAELTEAIDSIDADITEAQTIYAKWEKAPNVEGDNWVGVK